MNNKIGVLTNLCATIGNLPSSYLESMTYEEQLIWLCDFLQNTIIPALNDDIEAVTELQNLYIELKNYVDNYFDNLDIQQEVDNKINELLTDGTLQTLVDNYVQLNSIFGFDTIALMKASTNIDNGSIVKTLGNTTYDDGLGAFYKIRTLTSGDVVDEDKIISLTNFDTLIAEKIEDKNINDLLSAVSNIEDNIDDIEDNIDTIESDITNLKRNNTYSTSETLTDKVWIDGKPIYRKVIEYEKSADTTTCDIPHGITNIDKIIHLEGYSLLGGYYRPLTTFYPNDITTYSQGVYTIGGTNINVNFSTSYFGSSASTIYIIMEYTKSES